MLNSQQVNIPSGKALVKIPSWEGIVECASSVFNAGWVHQQQVYDELIIKEEARPGK